MKSNFVLFNLCLGICLGLAACGPRPTPTRPVPTATNTNSPTPLPRYTLVPTPDASLRLWGAVRTLVNGEYRGVAGATVGVTSCNPRSFDFTGTSDAEGHYEVFVPAGELNCGQTTLRVAAPGYQSQSLGAAVAELRAAPTHNFVLEPETNLQMMVCSSTYLCCSTPEKFSKL